jgi:hypothetical protein
MCGPVAAMAIADPELRIACIQAYNDWLSEFGTATPNRLLGVAILPPEDPAGARRSMCSGSLTIRTLIVPGHTRDRPLRSRWATSHPRCVGNSLVTTPRRSTVCRIRVECNDTQVRGRPDDNKYATRAYSRRQGPDQSSRSRCRPRFYISLRAISLL